MKYWIIKIDDAQRFQDRVNVLLNEGWNLYGNTFTIGSMGMNYFCQAFTKFGQAS